MWIRVYRFWVVCLATSLILTGTFWIRRARAGIFVVVSLSDAADSSPGDGICSSFSASQCTLRAAIMEANAFPGPDVITFNIGTVSPAINLTSPLPTITAPVIIDGNTGGAPRVQIVGSSAGASHGLWLGAGSGGSQIRSLIIRNFSGDGILIQSSGNTIQNCYIGTDEAGNIPQPNISHGIAILDGANNLIGGTTPAARNLISGNNNNGVFIDGNAARGNTVQGNFIGTNVNGLADLGNNFSGVFVGGSNNTIGGTEAGARNIISGNNDTGVSIRGSGNNVFGNYIGTNVNGTSAVGNSIRGVYIDGTFGGSITNNNIGVAVAGARNIISGNVGGGVEIAGSAATGNKVQGNYIGTDVNGTAALGNGLAGVTLRAPNNSVGGTDADDGAADGNVLARNIIAGNTREGVYITASGNFVLGNFIGTDVTGTVALGNNIYGVYIENTSNNTVGGTAAGARNVISGNNDAGLVISGSGASGNQVMGNYIGTDANGTAALKNLSSGIFVVGPNNAIGGTASGAGNVISANENNGVDIRNSSGNLVQGNFIGTDVTGTADLGNRLSGVLVSQGPNNTIGGVVAGARNLISGNNQQGVEIVGNLASGNQVQGNYIGTDVSGTAPLGNRNGVLISSTSNCTIGGTAAGARNLISGNTQNGIFILGGSGNHLILGNYIGTNAAGTAALGNTLDGVRTFETSNNRVGGASSGEGNVIAFNNGRGVNITASGGTSVGIAILNNSIFSNGQLGIDLNNDGVTTNDNLDSDTGTNNLQNFPVLTGAVSSNNSIAIQGTLSTSPGNFNLQFFSNTSCDPSTYGEGQTFLGSLSVSLGSTGVGTFAAGFLTSVAPGQQFITATATSADNNTSEFSKCIAVEAADNQSGLRIDAMSRRAGQTSGGQQLTLIGSFADLSTVTMGGVQASWGYTSGTSQITVTTPAHAIGAVDITLTSTGGSTYTKGSAFAYVLFTFTDDILVAGSTPAKVQHILELRQCVDALRAVAGLTPAQWTDPLLAPGNTIIKAIHIQELRAYLDEALTRLGFMTQPYTDPALGGLVIKRVHIEELRQRIRIIAN